MAENKQKYLLPNGFKDYLWDDAEAEFSALVTLLDAYSKAGYRKISPPAIEFDGADEIGAAGQKFKFIDPISQASIALRSDITPQISRIAASRLSNQELPLRLCYYGDVFQINPINIQGDRQLKQVGLEFITADLKAEYDVEVLRLAIESLTKLGLKNLTIDLNTPNLVKSLDEDYTAEVLDALAKKELAKLPAKLRKLTDLSGSAAKAFAALDEDLSEKARTQIEHVKAVYEGLKALNLPAQYTIDFVENRSTNYQEKLSFSIFSQNVRGAVGRGGRYKTAKSAGGLHATGFSLYLNNFLQAIE